MILRVILHVLANPKYDKHLISNTMSIPVSRTHLPRLLRAQVSARPDVRHDRSHLHTRNICKFACARPNREVPARQCTVRHTPDFSNPDRNRNQFAMFPAKSKIQKSRNLQGGQTPSRSTGRVTDQLRTRKERTRGRDPSPSPLLSKASFKSSFLEGAQASKLGSRPAAAREERRKRDLTCKFGRTHGQHL